MWACSACFLSKVLFGFDIVFIFLLRDLVVGLQVWDFSAQRKDSRANVHIDIQLSLMSHERPVPELGGRI